MSEADRPLVITSRFNRILAIAFWAVAATAVAVPLVTRSGVSLVPLGLWAAVAGYYLLWRPRLEIGEDALDVVNVLRRVRIPWAALVHVDTKYALTLYVPGSAVAVWCAPAPGPSGARRASRLEREQAGAASAEGLVRPGDLRGSESGRAADAVRRRWETLREAGAFAIGEADRTPAETRWDPFALTLLVGGGVLALAVTAAL